MACAAGTASAEDRQSISAVRIGLTAVLLDDEVALLNRWRTYLEKRLERPISYVQRGSYREVTELLLDDKLDFAWTCGAPYVSHRDRLRLVAVPLYQGRPQYQSYVIVPALDTETRRFEDLRGGVFAFSDPDSNSGFLYPQSRLVDLRETDGSFFRRTFFTWGHPRVVEAVAAGLARAGAVDGYVWETLAIRRPDLTHRTRVIEKSPLYGFPPVVARAGVASEAFLALQGVLTGMSGDTEGRQFLKELNLDGFIAGEPGLFADIERNLHRVNAHRSIKSARP